MGETEYSEALKLGKKEYRARIAKGQFPYLPVLDEILSEADIQTERIWGWYRCLWISLWEQAPWAGHIHLRQTLCRYWTGKPNLQ